MPRSSRPTLSPAWPWSSSLRNISTPVTVVLVEDGRMPTISTSSFTFTMPRSTRPVTTVPRPVMVNTSSTGMRNGLLISPPAPGVAGVDRVHQLHELLGPLRVALERLERRDANHRDVVAGELVLAEQLTDLQLDEL